MRPLPSPGCAGSVSSCRTTVSAPAGKGAPLPKIEVYRLAAGPEPLFDPAVHDPGDWVAMVTDNSKYHADFPVFRFSDTAWLVTIANLAWDRAKILPP